MSDHQRSLEELKASLSLGPAAPDGAEQNAQELRSTLEGLRMEHQLEVENLKAKHKIEAAILIKEREDLGARLQEARDQLGRPETDAAEKLQKAERRLAEMEQLQAEQDRSAGDLRERLELSEKKMTDYQALQKAQAESRGEIQRLEEKLRVTANQLQAAQADRYTSHDANVSPPPAGRRAAAAAHLHPHRSVSSQVIEDNEISAEKMKMKQNIEGTFTSPPILNQESATSRGSFGVALWLQEKCKCLEKNNSFGRY